MNSYLPFIRLLAERSGQIILKYFRTKLSVENKSDQSPVTIADREAENEMRQLIMSRYPTHGILGEELGSYQPDSEFQWVLDPIDGTRSFICGVPLVGTLIALLHLGTPILGAMHLPVFHELLIGDNRQTVLNDKIVSFRRCHTLSEAILLTTDLENIKKYQNIEKFRELISTVGLFRTWGDCYGYYLLATGYADIMIDPIMSPWDSLALIPIIRGAGGNISDYHGNDPKTGTSIIAANRDLHPSVITALKSI